MLKPVKIINRKNWDRIIEDAEKQLPTLKLHPVQYRNPTNEVKMFDYGTYSSSLPVAVYTIQYNTRTKTYLFTRSS